MSVGDCSSGGLCPPPVKATPDSDIICKSTWVYRQGSRTQEVVDASSAIPLGFGKCGTLALLSSKAVLRLGMLELGSKY